MKHKPDFILQQVADTYVVVPVGEQALVFNGILTLNGTGAFLWKQLNVNMDMAALVDALISIYEVDAATAQADVEGFVSILKDRSLLAD